MCDGDKVQGRHVVMFLLLIGLVVVSFYIGYRNAQIDLQAAAVESGHAERIEAHAELLWRDCKACAPAKVAE